MAQIMCNLIIDSCCDLPFEVVNVPGIELLKFPFLLSDGEHADDLYQSLSAHDFFTAMSKGETPSTAQIPVNAFVNAFTRAAQSGVPTVYLSFSSGLSGSFGTAELIRDQVLAEYPDAELYVVDTKLASIAEGTLVYEAMRQRTLGLTARELAAWAEEARFFVNKQFMIDDLGALRRGGRIPSSMALAGSKLDVKPMMDIREDGCLALSGVVRGRKKGIKQLVEYYRRHKVDSYTATRVIIGNADCPKDVERLKSELVKVDENVLFYETSIGPVIGSHVGPGMLAISFMGTDIREDLTVSDRIARKVLHK